MNLRYPNAAELCDNHMITGDMGHSLSSPYHTDEKQNALASCDECPALSNSVKRSEMLCLNLCPDCWSDAELEHRKYEQTDFN